MRGMENGDSDDIYKELEDSDFEEEGQEMKDGHGSEERSIDEMLENEKIADEDFAEEEQSSKGGR